MRWRWRNKRGEDRGRLGSVNAAGESREDDSGARQRDEDLMRAAGSGDLQRVRDVVELDGKLDITTAMVCAASKGHIEVVRYLAKRGAEVNTAYWDGVTPLMLAASEGYSDIVLYLCTHGADVNVVEMDGENALMRAADQAHLEAVRHLSRHGADVNAADRDGVTALMRAASIQRHLEGIARIWTRQTAMKRRRLCGV